MAANREWTPQQDAAIKDGNAAGKSLHSIAAELGIAKASVSRRSKALGLTWERTGTAQAVAAKQIDAKARRLDLLNNEYEIMATLQTHVLDVFRRKGQWRTIVRDAGGAERTETLDFVPSRDMRETTNARSGSAAIIAKLEAVDADGAEHVRSLLGGLAEKFGLVPTEARQ